MNGSFFLLLALFALDVALVAVAAWLVVGASGHARHGSLEALVAWLWSALALVAGAGIALGELGALSHAGAFPIAHAVALGGLLALRRRRWREDLGAARALATGVRAQLSTPGGERTLTLVFVAALGLLLALATWAAPVVYDGLTYRLSRIGAWWQSGQISALPTSDPRLNYMPVVPDVIIAWLLSATAEGFRHVALAQALGGVALAFATVGLARESGLGRQAALLSGLLLLGLPNVLSQFTSTQTDLLTAGLFAAAFYLWWRALRRGEASWCGAIGAGLALGAKGTVLYLAPGAALWVGWLAWRHRLAWRGWRRLAVAAMVGAVCFAGLGLARNFSLYGGLFGPPEAVRAHQRLPASPADLAQKLGLNLLASAAQLVEPHSQPPGLQGIGRAVGQALAAGLPERDADAFEPRGRRATVEQILARREPDADTTTFGAWPVALFLAGTALAMARWRDPTARLMLVWATGVAGFVVFLSAIQQWHGYGFRFFVLAAPWLVIVAAWALEQAAAAWRLALWGATLAGAGATAACLLATTHQIGWRAIAQPERSVGYHVFLQWREWTGRLAPGDSRLTVALPPNLPLAAFFRLAQPRPVVLAPEPAAATAAAAVPADGRWLVVSAGRYLGREGDVVAETWLFQGDDTQPYSLAAYRRRQPGESPASLLYRHTASPTPAGTQHDLLVKTWAAGAPQLELHNPASEPRLFTLLTPAGGRRGELPAGTTATLDLPLERDAVSAVRVTIAEPATAPPVPPVAVRLRRPDR